MDSLPTIKQVQPVVNAISVVQSKVIAASITVTAPCLEWDSGYVRRKLDVALNSSQAARLKSIQLGLEQKEARLANGKYVANPVDAIRWLLENAV